LYESVGLGHDETDLHIFTTRILCFVVILLLDELCTVSVLSVLWRCWLGGRKGIWGTGTGMVVCLDRGANDLHMVQLMALQ